MTLSFLLEVLMNHLNDLEEVFQRLLNANLKLKPSKCNFCRREIIYLGRIINENGLHMDKDKIKAMKKFPRPNNVK